MTIIDTVKMPGYTQWIENFVKNVLDKAKVSASEVTIVEMHNKRVYITCDGEKFMINTFSFTPAGKDESGMTCSEDVKYVLYIGHEPCSDASESIHLPSASEGVLNVQWNNSSEIYKEEVRQYHTLHGDPCTLEQPKEGEYITLKAYDVCGSSWDMNIDIRTLRQKEVAPVMNYLLTGKLKKKYDTYRIHSFIKDVYKCAAREILDFCFEDDCFDFEYAMHLIVASMNHGYCSRENGIQQGMFICNLAKEYNNGSKDAIENIRGSLGEFCFRNKPFYFTAA